MSVWSSFYLHTSNRFHNVGSTTPAIGSHTVFATVEPQVFVFGQVHSKSMSAILVNVHFGRHVMMNECKVKGNTVLYFHHVVVAGMYEEGGRRAIGYLHFIGVIILFFLRWIFA